jgi:hypothetical protein
MLFLGEFHFVSDLCVKAEWGQFFPGDSFFWRVVYLIEDRRVNYYPIRMYGVTLKFGGDER